MDCTNDYSIIYLVNFEIRYLFIVKKPTYVFDHQKSFHLINRSRHNDKTIAKVSKNSVFRMSNVQYLLPKWENFV